MPLRSGRWLNARALRDAQGADLQAQLELFDRALEAGGHDLDALAQALAAVALGQEPATALAPGLARGHHSLHLPAGRGLHQQLPPTGGDGGHLRKVGLLACASTHR